MATCEMTRIQLSDGYEGFARLWMPRQPRGGVLYLHGIQSHGGWYERSAAHLATAGLAVLLPDRRGSGRNQVDRGHAPSAKRLLTDVSDYLDELHILTGLTRFHLVGVSWGGKLALASFRQVPSRVESLTLSAPGLFPKVDIPTSQKVRVALSLVAARKTLFDIPLKDPTLFTVHPECLEFIERDELSLKQVTTSFLMASRWLDRYAQGVDQQSARCPIHLMLAEHDRVIDNDKSRTFVEGLGWPESRITLYDNAHHTLEFEPDPEPYFNDLLNGLALQLPST